MIFSTYSFIFVFLPLVFAGYFLFNRLRWYTAAKLYLVLASLFFYAQGTLEFLPFFVGSIFFNYIIGTSLISAGKQQINETKERRWLFISGVLANVGLLGYYKYTDFLISSINAVSGTDFPLREITLPIGISFFTFQLIAFLVDCYRGEAREYGLLNYLLFITFFPQLIVGPIVHHGEMVPQFENRDNTKINFNNVSKGIFLFSIGCAKKILLADMMTPNAQTFFDHVGSRADFLSSWFYSLEYTISYYFDLSGYADMAIGLGLMFNIVISHNFDSPYKARNFQEYWRRWHMTLSRFLGDYIFKSVFRKNVPYRNYYIATMVTFFVSGFWHGAGWTFVVWGIVNGIFVCTASWMGRKGWKFPFPVSFALTFAGVVMLRALFVVSSFGDAFIIYQNMFSPGYLFEDGISGCISLIGQFILTHGKAGLFMTVGLIICWCFPNSRQISERFRPCALYWAWSFILLMLCLMNMNKAGVFLYFQF